MVRKIAFAPPLPGVLGVRRAIFTVGDFHGPPLELLAQAAGSGATGPYCPPCCRGSPSLPSWCRLHLPEWGTAGTSSLGHLSAARFRSTSLSVARGGSVAFPTASAGPATRAKGGW